MASVPPLGANPTSRFMVTELFGVLAVTAMVVSYALEKRAATFVLVFALACAGAAAYAVLIRSWPFAAVEAVWCVIALRRWRERRSGRVGAEAPEAGGAESST
jgi:hypothetical protein